MTRSVTVVAVLRVLSWCCLVGLGFAAEQWDNDEHIFVYDTKAKTAEKANDYCKSEYQTTLGTILSEDTVEKLQSLDPYADNATVARECWIGLEYRLIDVYDPFPYLIPTYENVSNETVAKYRTITELIIEYNPYYNESTDNITTEYELLENITFCNEIFIENTTTSEYNSQIIVPCAVEHYPTLAPTKPPNITTTSNGENSTNANSRTAYCVYEEILIENIDYSESYIVCGYDTAYNYSNYYGYIWRDNSSMTFENWYNYSYWNKDRSEIVPTAMPTNPPTNIYGKTNWTHPTVSPTFAPTVWAANESFCVSMDMVTGEWFPHRECTAGKLNCWICDTNLYIAENDDYVFHYDLTTDSNLAKNWDEADQFCRDNYKRKACSIKSKDDDMSIMSLIFSMTSVNFTDKVINETLEYKKEILARNDSDEKAQLDELLEKFYFEIEWLQSENTYFRFTKQSKQSMWFGLFGEVVFQDYCFDFNQSGLSLPDWVTNDTVIDDDFIIENVLTLENCNWTLEFVWIDNSEQTYSWYDFTWGSGEDARYFPNITQDNWDYVESNYYSTYKEYYSPENISCVAMFYNQTARDWRWKMYPCEDSKKIAWCCNAPIRKYEVNGDTGLTETSWKDTAIITASATLVALIFVFPITLFVTLFCIKYYGIDKKGDFVIDCVDFIICTKCRSNYQRQKAAQAGELLNKDKQTGAGLAGWLNVNFSQKLSAVAAYAEDTETQEYLYEIHWPKEAQYWGQPARLNGLEYFIRLSSKRTMLRVWKVFDEDSEDRIPIRETWSRVMYCWLAMYLIEKHEGQVEAPPSYDRVRPIFDKISYEITHFLPKKEKEFMKKEDYMESFRRWLYKICRRRQILLKRYSAKIKKERERLEIEDPNRPKDSNSSDEEPPVLFNPGSIIFSDTKAKNKKTFESDDDDDDNDDDDSNSEKDNENGADPEDADYSAQKQIEHNKKIEHQFSTRQVVPIRKDISMKELEDLGKGNKNALGKKKNNNGRPLSPTDHEVAQHDGVDMEDLLDLVNGDDDE